MKNIIQLAVISICRLFASVNSLAQIHIVSPDGGEYFQKGTNMNITWGHYINNTSYVHLFLYKGPQWNRVLEERILYFDSSPENNSLGEHSIGWTIPADIQDGSYHLYVEVVYGPSNTRITDYGGDFTIGSSPDISEWIVSPNGGETHYVGQDIYVNLDASAADPSSISMELFKGGSRVLGPIVTSRNGSRRISLDNMSPGTDYKVKVYDTNDPSMIDESDDNFTINAVPDLTDWVVTPSLQQYYKAGRYIDVEVNEAIYTATTKTYEVYKGDVKVFGPSTGGTRVALNSSWAVPGDDYRLKVIDANNPVAWGFSDYFEIGPEGPQILTPTGGEEFTHGDVLQAELDLEYAPGDYQYHHLLLMKGDDSQIRAYLFYFEQDGTENTEFTIPYSVEAGSDYRLQLVVRHNDNSETIKFTDYFSIVQADITGWATIGSSASEPYQYDDEIIVNIDFDIHKTTNAAYGVYRGNELMLGPISRSYSGSEHGQQYLGQFQIDDNFSSSTKYTVKVIDNIHSTYYDNVEEFTVANDKNLNHITMLSFDEYGNAIASSRSIFDMSGQMIQSQSKNHTENMVMIAQPIFDRYDRVVISPLAAPSGYSEFFYYEDFITDENGNPYSYLNFDNPGDPSKFSNPDPINQNSGLGWYYSDNNTLEDHVPTTLYPYSRTEYYQDGTGDMMRSAGPGEILRLGGGHEVLQGAFAVGNELDEYLSIRHNEEFAGVYSNPTGNLMKEAIQQVVKDENGNYEIIIGDRAENVLMSAIGGDEYTITNTVSSDQMIYFYLLDPSNVNISGGSFVVEDIVNNQVMQNFTTLEAGFYRVLVNSGTTSVTYANSYEDISYSFYDDAGRLITSLTPNGVKEYRSGIAYSLLDKTTYEYNHQGWLLSSKEPDAGLSKYKYRKDGGIRFSQNSEQAKYNTFSYTDYDDIGRPIESGEYFGTVSFEAGLSGLLENTGWNNWTEKRDWVKTYYDVPADNFNTETNLGSIYYQDFITTGVSWTENPNIKTWYSYDYLGRVTWMAQKPIGLPLTFVMEYDYDFLGNVLRVANKTYESGGLKDQFYHHYEYDADKRLSKTSTSTDGVLANATLQAKYIYYLHGPLKRIELAEDLQGIDFVYNINGWLKSINHPDTALDPGQDGEGNGFKKDAFGMILNYYENDLGSFSGLSSADIQPNPFEFHGLEKSAGKLLVSNLHTKINLTDSDKRPEQYHQVENHSLTLSRTPSPFSNK